ncbi:MAG: gliding motility-associated C-terminal domain-containing protein [Bacteroidota bacterium]|nr:gliding motility-associated C-terminal domain-containing protein [Bacteroidota bacterium]
MKKITTLLVLFISVLAFKTTAQKTIKDSLEGFNEKHAWGHTDDLKTLEEKNAFYEQLKRNWLKHKYNLFPANAIENNANNFKPIGGSNSTMQGPQPANCTNIDFESGNTSSWVTTGLTSVVTGPGNDPHCGFPMVYPGGNSSLKISGDWTVPGSGACFCTSSTSNGNFCTSQASRVITVAPGNTQLQLHYAFVVYKYPSHTNADAAYIEVSILNAAGVQLACPYFKINYTSGVFNGVPGITPQNSPNTISGCTGNYNAVYIPWQTANADLSPYVGQNVTIIVKVKWCQYQCDWAYAYIDADCLNSTYNIAPVCPGVNACAPAGFASYTWTIPGGGTATGQCITPSNNGIYTVTAAPSITCSPLQTMTLSVVGGFTPTVNSSNIKCNGANDGSATVTTIGSSPTSYSWIPSAGATTVTTNSTFTGLAPGSYSVKITDGNCIITKTFTITQPPLLNLVSAQTTSVLCNVGNNGVATATASGGTSPYTYVWNPSASTASTATGLIAGTYTVEVTDANGCKKTSNPIITEPTAVTAGITTNTFQVCMGFPINFTANPGGGIGAPYTYSWSTGSTISNPSIAETTGGTYSYTVTVFDGNNCSASAIKTVTFVPNPNVICDNKDMCYGHSANLFANGATNYSWSPSTALNVTYGSAVIASPSVTTVYTLVGNNSFCNSVINVTVGVIPYPDAIISSPNQEICFGNSTTINATGAMGYNWAPNYAISSLVDPSVVVSPSVTTNYTITSYNFSGTVVCAETKMMPIHVVPQVTPSISSNAVICAGEKTTLYAGGGNTFAWTPSVTLNQSNISGVVASPSVSTIYTVHISNSAYCGHDATVSVIVNPLPSLNAGRDTTFNLDEPMFLSAKGTGTLTWTSGEGIFCSVCPETKITATHSGCYVIETVNEFGCKAKDDVCIEVTTNSGVFIPNAFSPNGDGLNEVFLVYGYSISDVTMDIFDRWGEKLFSSTDQKLGWDGSYKGKPCSNDSYVYKISYKGLDGKKQYKTGHVSINR